ncbi:NUDIX domain-containing protein [Marinomonas epiphytica]
MVKEWQEGKLVINQPAGHVENGESLTQAVIREVLEETGWKVSPIALLGSYSFTPYVGSDTYHRVCFLCDPIEQVSTQLDEDIDSCVWLSEQDIKQTAHRSPLVAECIEDAKTAPMIKLEFIKDHFLLPESGKIS